MKVIVVLSFVLFICSDFAYGESVREQKSSTQIKTFQTPGNPESIEIISNDYTQEMFEIELKTADYYVQVEGYEFLTLSPGDSAVYQFRIKNRGLKDDTYELKFTSSKGWEDTSQIPSVVTVLSHEEDVIEIPVFVPHDAADGDRSEFILRARSQSNPFLVDGANSVTTAKY